MLAKTLQASVSTPLQLDSADPEALESACRVYAGRPLINSVNGKPDSLARVLPIAARYGAMLIVDPLDERCQDAVRLARRLLAASR